VLIQDRQTLSWAHRDLNLSVSWSGTQHVAGSIFSFSFSIRSATSASLAETSTGLAAPNGFGRLVLAGLGEERGETTVDVLVDLGVSSSFLRAGVGGVD